LNSQRAFILYPSPMHIYKLFEEDSPLHVVSPFSSTELTTLGLDGTTILGRIKNTKLPITHDNIEMSSEFMVMYHQAVRDIMCTVPDVVSEASQQENGFVFIVDGRAPEGKDIPKEDIIGIFLVNERKTDASRYRPNPDYRWFTQSGAAQMPHEVAIRLFEKFKGYKGKA